jgi:hypothetical protein
MAAANWIGRSSKEKCTLIEWSVRRLNRPSAADIDAVRRCWTCVKSPPMRTRQH